MAVTCSDLILRVDDSPPPQHDTLQVIPLQRHELQVLLRASPNLVPRFARKSYPFASTLPAAGTSSPKRGSACPRPRHCRGSPSRRTSR
ncbi:hypothetical protein BC827DRAFT_37815 [Russula dissimulans]|nr:hypothetical protein BC827DRAFT_37815 [Russula dissimulans]